MLTLNFNMLNKAKMVITKKFWPPGREAVFFQVLKGVISSETSVAIGFLGQKKHSFGVPVLARKNVKKGLFLMQYVKN